MFENMKQGGFTLIEILVVVVLSAIIVTIGVPSFFAYKSRQNLELTMRELSAKIKETQKRSVTQQDGKRWGVLLQSSTTGIDYYEIFTGSSYSTSTVEEKYSFRRSVEFTEPSNGRSVEISFEPISGKISSAKIISISLDRPYSKVADVVINPFGRITAKIRDGILGYWHLDEGTGSSTYDATGNSFDGSISGNLVWLSSGSCKAGQCLSFDNTDDYIDVQNFKLGDTHTVTFWFYLPPGDGGWDQILAVKSDSTDRAPGIWTHTNYPQRIHWKYNPGNLGPDNIGPGGEGTDFDTNTWYFIAGAKDGAEFRFYVNGSFVASTTVPSPMTEGSYLRFGLTSYAPRSMRIDEVKMYNYALTDDEILEIYNELK